MPSSIHPSISSQVAFRSGVLESVAFLAAFAAFVGVVAAFVVVVVVACVVVASVAFVAVASTVVAAPWLDWVFVVENFVGAFVVADAVAVAVVVAGVVVVVAVVVVELVHIRPNSYGVCHHSLAFPLVLRDVGAPKW